MSSSGAGRRTSERSKLECLERILNSVPQVIWSAGPDGDLDFVSNQWRSDYGGDPAELVGNGWLHSVHPDDAEEAAARWESALKQAELYQAQFRIRVPDGAYRWVLVTAAPEIAPDGSILRWFGTCIDVHDRIVAEQALADKERLYRSVLEASADCIKIVGSDGGIQLMNAPGLELMDFPSAETVEGFKWWSFWPEDMRETVEDSVRRASQGETVRFRGSCPTFTGKPKWWDVVVTPIREEDDSITRVLALSRDSTVDVQKSEQLRWASEHDSLTGLPNRGAFQTRLEDAVLRSMRSKLKVGLLLIDVDHFKHVNDTLGHFAGDKLLHELARRLKRTIRNGDFVARVGGDEFAVIVEDLRSTADLLAVGHGLFTVLKSPLRLDGRETGCGASIGGAVYPDDADTANDLFKLADTALYALKKDGRGGARLFHSHMRQEAQLAASQLRLARAAVDEQTIEPVFQPQVDLKTGDIIGYEALLRWRTRGGKLQLPETIEEAFKEYELATRMSELMQVSVYAQMRTWIESGIDFGRVALNAAPAEFLRGDYAERFLERLSSAAIPAHCLELEVTEHALLERGSRHVESALSKLKAAGVSISLDDFGTGYSSLSHLRDFPVDVVKIDRSFTKRIDDDEEVRSIVVAVVNLAKSLAIDVIAEGIETRKQVELLRTMGCRLGQGFALGRPISGDEVLAARASRSAA